jgi:hypothetical protein
MRNGTASTANALGGGGPGGLPSSISMLSNVPGFMLTQQTGHLEFMTRMVEIARRPPEEWAGPLATEQAAANELPVLARMLVPATAKMAEACVRNHASLRCAIVAVAAERYRGQHGQWPATPDDLVKAGLLKAVPTDPYAAGQRIKFARPKDGLIVYSTGPDGIDNGGNLDPSSYPPKPGTDRGLRLWDVPARRQPPLPPKAAETP